MNFIRALVFQSLIALVFLLPACGGGGTSEDFTNLDALSLTGTQAVPEGEYVIRTESEYDLLRPYLIDPVPILDFGSQMIVGISLGARGPCEWVEIRDAQYRENKITVHYKHVFQWTGSSCLGSPFSYGTLGAFVIVPKSSKQVHFERLEE